MSCEGGLPLRICSPATEAGCGIGDEMDRIPITSFGTWLTAHFA